MGSTSNSFPPPANRNRNWVELPAELTVSIFQRVGAIDMLMSGRKVCKTWRQICSDPEMWRVMDLRCTGDLCDIDLRKMARLAVDMSSGQLIDLCLRRFADDDLLSYISDRSSQLRRLCLVSCYGISNDGLSEMVKKLPLLEELHLYHISVYKQAIEVAGRYCPKLKSVTVNIKFCGYPDLGCNDDALAIAENMPGLRHLQLLGNRITSDGLLAILENCPHLESLNIRRCLNVVYLEPDLLRRLSQQMKDLRLTDDSREDDEFDNESDYEYDDLDSFDAEDHPSGLSDIDIVSDDCDYYDDDYDSNEYSGGSDRDSSDMDSE